MQQYFAKNKDLELKESDYHHIKNVMRMKKGDEVKIVYDKITYNCVISDLNTKVSFNIISKETKEDDKVLITVSFSLIKEQKLDFLLQKSTELGAYKFIPVNTKRSVVKIDSKKESKKIERWNEICKEASEQSFRNYVPNVTSIKNLKDLIGEEYDLKLLCSLNKNTKNIKKVLQNNNKCDRILLVVGPEGGFTKDEEEFLTNSGFISVSLGKNVLRAETAPVSAISMINYEFMR